MKKTLIVIMTITTLLFSGCARIRELDEKSFVTAIGVDKGENYSLKFTFVFTNPSKSGSGSATKEKDETIVIEAPSLYSAIEQINNFTSKSIELTHTQTIVFSEELSKEGLSEYIYMLVRSSHFRPNTYVCIADKSSMEFLENINPLQAFHLEKYFQQIFNKMTSGTKGDMYLYDSYFRMLSESNASVLPYCAINEISLKQPPEESPTEESSEAPSEGETMGGMFAPDTDDFAINIIAGDTISQSKNTSEIQGVGVLKDGRMITVLGKVETMCLQLITNSMPNNYITVSNPQSPDNMITCYVVQREKTRVDVELKEKPVIKVKIKLEGDFSEVGENAFFIKEPKLFEEHLENKTKETINTFLNKISRELESDICGFSDAAKCRFLTVEEWKKYNFDEKFKNAVFEVDVDYVMRTYGELAQNA